MCEHKFDKLSYIQTVHVRLYISFIHFVKTTDHFFSELPLFLLLKVMSFESTFGKKYIPIVGILCLSDIYRLSDSFGDKCYCPANITSTGGSVSTLLDGQ